MTTTTWRDIADQLTPEQIAEMEEWESQHPDEQKGLLLEARDYAEDNLRGMVMFPHITPPPDAQGTLGCWTEQSGQWSREFDGTGRDPLREFEVSIAGRQYCDGTTERYAKVYGSEKQRFTSGDLRVAAAVLIAAADELDRLTD